MTVKARYWLAGTVVLAIAGAFLLLRNTGADSAPPATVAVKRGDVTFTVAAAGTVQPIATRDLAFSSAGTVTLVSVAAGDTVAAGQTLATIEATAAKDAVTQAQSTLDTARTALTNAKATPSPAPSGRPTQSATKDSVYPAEVSVTKAEQALAKAKRALTGTTITAPVAGKVMKVNGKAGSQAGTAAFITLAVVEKMMVRAEFAEADAVSVAVGQKALVQLGSVTQPVTVSQVAVLGTVTDRLVRYAVLLAFDSPPADLLIGQTATAQVVIARADNVLYLPQSAVKSNTVRRSDGSSITVETGLRGDGWVEVKTGVAEGDLVRLNAS